MAAASVSTRILTGPPSLNCAVIYEKILTGKLTDDNEKFCCEAFRLASFEHFPEDNCVAPTRLARAGFYATGQSDEVQCFSCKGRIREWKSGETPMERHKRIFPNCPFVTGVDTSNYEIIAPGDQTFIDFVFSQKEHTCTVLSEQLNNGRGEDITGDISDSATSSHTNGEVLNCTRNCLNGKNFTDSKDSCSSSLAFAQTISDTLVFPNLEPQRQSSRNSDYTRSSDYYVKQAMQSDVEARLQTYRNFPSYVPVRPGDLAKAGFYYTGSADMVKCAFCSGMIRNWEQGDTAFGEHKKHFPRCKFVVDRAHEFNSYSEQCDGNPIVFERPKHPKYAIEQTRLNSFKNWPAHKTQKPPELAHAGFFYAGFNDNVKCFFCDGGLRNWESGDLPWVEHARWFPRCGYVKSCKGIDFIQSISRESSDFNNSQQPNMVRGLDMREVKARMDSPAVRTILEMGYPATTVKKVVENQLRNHKDDFPNMQGLLEALFQIEETDSQQGNHNDGALFRLQTSDESNQRTSSPVRAPTVNTKGNESKHQKQKDKKKDPKVKSPISKKNTNKKELSEAEQLLRENKEMKKQKICKICFKEDVCVLLLPCAHLVSCDKCAPGLRECPVCTAGIKGTVKTFLS